MSSNETTGEVRLREGEIVSSGAEHAIVAAISAWRPALEGAVARGPCQMTTTVATKTQKRWSSGGCRFIDGNRGCGQARA